MEQVTLKGPVPEIRGIFLNGERYIRADDMVAWFHYVADNVVDEAASEQEQVDQQVVANVLRIMADFSAKRAAHIVPV